MQKHGMGYCPSESRYNGLYRDTEAGKTGLARGRVAIQNCIVAERGVNLGREATQQGCDAAAARSDTTTTRRSTRTAGEQSTQPVRTG